VSRSPAERIADLTGSDLAEVKEGRYQPAKYSRPSVFVVGEDYYAAGDAMPKHQVGQPWKAQKTWRGDTVWESKMEDSK